MKAKLADRYVKNVDIEMAKDKRGDFRRLAERRTLATLDGIRKIENLSNRANYEYDAAQVNRVFTTLREALDEAQGKFHKADPKRRDFRL